jgi:hypothetical protein
MLELKELSVSCMCGATQHSFSIPTTSLPLSTHLCSCDISRRISGSLLTSYVNITHGTEAPKPDLTAVTPYKSSDILTRHFCSTCGTQMYLEYKHDGHFEAATGTLQVDKTDGLVEYKAHIWIEDTLDGGASQFITQINGKELGRFLQEPYKSEEVQLSWTAPSIYKDGSDALESIYAHCHCKGVEFYVSPPNESSRAAESDYPDLMIPYHSGNSQNPTNNSWWLPRHDRFLAGTCACISCRRASGFDITFWAFIPAVNITQDSLGTKPFSRSPYWGTMKTYQSSQGVTRTFCSRCGANVFWDCDWREGLVDVAVGLLDAPSGARAEELLAWWPGRVSFEEFALNRSLVRGLEDGLKGWAGRNKGATCVAHSESYGV